MHTRIAANSPIQFLESHYQKNSLVKVFSTHPKQKCGPLEIYAKLNWYHLLMAHIFKLHEYQTSGFMKVHNMSKICFVNIKFSL